MLSAILGEGHLPTEHVEVIRGMASYPIFVRTEELL